MQQVRMMMNRRFAWTWMMLLALPLWLGSCSKDKDGNGEPDVKPSTVEGSWKFSGIKVNPAIDPFGTGTKTNDFLGLMGQILGNEYVACFTDIKITFNGNGTISATPSPKCQTADDENPVEDKSTWKVDGNKLTITSSDGAEVYDITRDGSTLKMSSQQVDDLDGDGKNETYTMTYELKKA